MKVEIWSDVVCPWCYIGKRRFETALDGFAHRDDIELTWRSFELDPGAAKEPVGDLAERLARKYGMSVAQARAKQAEITDIAAADGLVFHFERARSGNTFDAHRLIHLAADYGLQDAVKERLMRAYFTEGEAISDAATLIRVVSEAGLDADEVRAVLASDRYAADVRADERRAAALGISGVPFFVIDDKYGVSGAQSPETLRDVLETSWTETHPLTMAAPDAELACEGETCFV